jgi:hypothetical protein
MFRSAAIAMRVRQVDELSDVFERRGDRKIPKRRCGEKPRVFGGERHGTW